MTFFIAISMLEELQNMWSASQTNDSRYWCHKLARWSVLQTICSNHQYISTRSCCFSKPISLIYLFIIIGTAESVSVSQPLSFNMWRRHLWGSSHHVSILAIGCLHRLSSWLRCSYINIYEWDYITWNFLYVYILGLSEKHKNKKIKKTSPEAGLWFRVEVLVRLN